MQHLITCNTSWRIIMSSVSRPKASRVNAHARRRRLRQQGLRPIQIWVPDVRAPAFRSQAHRQSLAVAGSSHARKDQVFINAVSDRGTEDGGDE
jgi:Protein  of unknown function (DUF3018)